MNYRYGKWASGVAYRYARGVSREYQCSQCRAAWIHSALTVCFDCRTKNLAQEQTRILTQAKEYTMQKGYLSFSGGAYRVIVQGMPICKDGPALDALRAAQSLRVELQPEAWDGDRGEWVSLSTIEELPAYSED